MTNNRDGLTIVYHEEKENGESATEEYTIQGHMER